MDREARPDRFYLAPSLQLVRKKDNTGWRHQAYRACIQPWWRARVIMYPERRTPHMLLQASPVIYGHFSKYGRTSEHFRVAYVTLDRTVTMPLVVRVPTTLFLASQSCHRVRWKLCVFPLYRCSEVHQELIGAVSKAVPSLLCMSSVSVPSDGLLKGIVCLRPSSP